MTEIVIAGSRQVDPELIMGAGLERFLLVQAHATIRLRRGLGTAPGPLEAAVAEYCEHLDIDYLYYQPKLRVHGGRQAVWYRDTDMIATADLVLCYYLEGQDDDSGTVGLVDKAMGMEVPVYAYGQVDERIIRIGEHDTDDLWGSRIPGAAILTG